MAEIVNVIYRASSGKEYPFQMEKTVRIKSANFHNWAYTPDVLARRFGESVLRFGKEAAAYDSTLYVSGPIEERRELLKEMHTAFERDIRKAQMGRLFWGDSYIDCYIRTSSTYPESKGLSYTVNDIEIYCPYPFWIEPKEYEFTPTTPGGGTAIVGSAIVGTATVVDDSEEVVMDFLDYPHGYNYDYSPDASGVKNIINDAPAEAPFIMVIYGPAVNPYFYVGDRQYIVYTNLQQGEYLTIDTQKKKVYRTAVNGQIINEFNNRGKTSSIFEPIPEGSQKVIWPATFGMTLTLLKERSEPVWS